MAPVVRVSDRVFSRLQSLATPFVDTPSSVIERLLDLYADSSSAPSETLKDGLGDQRHAGPQEIRIPTGFNFILAPASIENIRCTIEALVSVETACHVLGPANCEILRNLVGARTSFHCWAMTRNKRDVFKSLKAGDVVLFSVKSTGRYDYRATVAGKLESEALANSLWPVASGLPWELIYVVEDVRRIAVRKDALNAELGYERAYRVPGVLRVNTDAVRRMISRHGSLDAALAAST